MTSDRGILDVIQKTARPIMGHATDFDPIVERCRGRQFILLGEASHGTHDFYAARADITRRLVTELGCTAVAVEADWPDAYRVNRYVRGLGEDGDAAEALGDFRRFPQWMWRNAVLLDFVGWLGSSVICSASLSSDSPLRNLVKRSPSFFSRSTSSFLERFFFSSASISAKAPAQS